jgi:hypothetical protein
MRNCCLVLATLFVMSADRPVMGQGQARFAVVTIRNNTNTDMSFYRKWVWSFGTPQAKTHLDWRITKIPPGKSFTVKYTYQGKETVSPDLIVVFDSDRNNGAHWEMVKLARAADTDQIDGFIYALEYDGQQKEYASLNPKNRGTVTVIDRRTTRPNNAEEVPFKN